MKLLNIFGVSLLSLALLVLFYYGAVRVVFDIKQPQRIEQIDAEIEQLRNEIDSLKTITL